MPYGLKQIAGCAAATVALAAVTAGPALAEAVYADDRTAIRARAGEQARIVVRVEDGERLEVIEREGRWIRVAYQGETGWVTRTSVRGDEGEDVTTPQERRRQRQREQRRARQREREREREERRQREDESGFGRTDGERDEMPLVVTADRSEVYEAPDPGADVAFVAAEGDRLLARERREGFFRVRARGGESGWIAREDVGDPAAVEDARPRPEEAPEESSGDAEDGAPRGPGAIAAEEAMREEEGEEPDASRTGEGAAPRGDRPMEIAVGAGAGASSLGLDYATETPASAAGFASGLALSGIFHYPVGASVDLGADIRYHTELGIGELGYDLDGDELEGPGFYLFDLDLAARVRYANRDGLGLVGRAGLYYSNLFVRDLQSEANLPREEVTGFTAGVGLEIPLGEAAAAEIGGAALLAASFDQTSGSEDGEDVENIGAVWARAGLLYELAPGYHLDARYQLGRHTQRWSGDSQRISGEEDAERKELRHRASLGVRATF